MVNPEAETPEVASEHVDETLGKRLHLYEARSSAKKKGGLLRQLEITGVLAVIMVPVSLMYVKGTWSIVLAVFGGVVAVLAWYLSGRKPVPKVTTIGVFAGGVRCSENEASRQVLWNQVVEVKSKRFPQPDGGQSVAVVLEVVGEPPLLFVVGSKFSSASDAVKLLEALAKVWLPVWCRRARVMIESGRELTVGRAKLGYSCLTLEEHEVPWSVVTGVDSTEPVEALRTTDGSEAVEGAGLVVPFPSAARRLAALAACPPEVPRLPGG